MTDAAKGGWVALTPEEIERQANGPTRVVWVDVLEECDIGDGGSIKAKRHIAEFLEWQYWFNKDVMLLARRIHPEKRASIPNLPDLLERIGEHYPHDVLLETIIKRLDPSQRVRDSHVSRDALAIATVMGMMFSDNMKKTDAITKAASKLNIRASTIEKIPYINNLKTQKPVNAETSVAISLRFFELTAMGMTRKKAISTIAAKRNIPQEQITIIIESIR